MFETTYALLWATVRRKLDEVKLFYKGMYACMYLYCVHENMYTVC